MSNLFKTLGGLDLDVGGEQGGLLGLDSLLYLFVLYVVLVLQLLSGFHLRSLVGEATVCTNRGLATLLLSSHFD